jgi:hypothetical protein
MSGHRGYILEAKPTEGRVVSGCTLPAPIAFLNTSVQRTYILGIVNVLVKSGHRSWLQGRGKERKERSDQAYKRLSSAIIAYYHIFLSGCWGE